jgi:murein DD-endopeptidase MepM/ murein hydrolase activator NlpD
VRVSRWGVRGIAGVTLLLVAGCSAVVHESKGGEGGIYHEVRQGENLYRIGKAYGISHRELARVNNIAEPDRLEVGQRIFVPGGQRVLPVDVITPKRALVEAPEIREFPRGRGIFIWPLASGTLTSTFGPRGQSFHDGIDIGAPPGTPVRAARDGSVIYSDTLRGYGNVVIVEHTGGYATVYAHNELNLVHAGDRVRQGQAVARLGRSGRTSGPNLHFEIRKDNFARNPVYFLPSETAQRAKDGPT